MASYNRVILMGNLTRDIELRFTPQKTPVAEVGLAVNERRKSASGDWIDETMFVDLVFWGKTAEIASEHLGKGSPIFIEGRLKLDSWETDGQKRSKHRVVVERMQFIGAPRHADASRPRTAPSSEIYVEHAIEPHREIGESYADENIPF